MVRKLFTYTGIAALGAGTYYLYSAGGNPKLAEKKFEHDAATAARRLKGDLPGSAKEARKAGEESYEAVRATAQQYADQAKGQVKQAEKQFDAYSADALKKLEEAKAKAGKQVNTAANEFDKAVIDKAQEGKSWLSGFTGGK